MNITDLYRSLFGRSGTSKGSDIDMSEQGRVGGIPKGQPFKFTDSPPYAVKLTEDGDVIYLALAPVGTTEDLALWQAFKLDSTTGLKITYADGDADFDNIATDLTALVYS